MTGGAGKMVAPVTDERVRLLVKRSASPSPAREAMQGGTMEYRHTSLQKLEANVGTGCDGKGLRDMERVKMRSCDVMQSQGASAWI
jgi:hypothetical protein